MQNLLLYSLLVFSFSASARETVVEPSIISRVVFKNYINREVQTPDGLTLKYIEITDEKGEINESAPGILLQHGFTSNMNSWLYTPDELVRLGFRVFVGNWRGHGQGKMQSIVAGEPFNGRDPRYSFENAAVYDTATMVRELRRLTGHKVTYVGHSMGGMIMHLALAGLTRDEAGELVLSDEAGEALERDLAAFIAVGSPLIMEGEDVDKQDIKKQLITFVVNNLGLRLDHSNRISEWFLPFTVAEYALMRAVYEVARLKSRSGAIDVHNLSFDEFLSMHQYAGSDVPAAFMRSLQKVSQNRYGSNGIDFHALSMRRAGYRTRVATHLVSADSDTLAPLEEQNELAKVRGVDQTIMADTGHIGMVSAQSRADILVRVIAKVALENAARSAVSRGLKANCDLLLAGGRP